MKKEFVLIFFLFHFAIFAQRESKIIISEIMFASSEKDGEFIELYNCSDSTAVNLDHYKIIYSSSTADTIISFRNGSILPPKSFAVILENDYNFTSGIYMDVIPDTSLILQIDNGKFGSSGMANSADRTIYLLNEMSDTIVTYTYSANNNSGISDEKIILEGNNEKNNWGNSIQENGTPGLRNSVSPKDYDLEITSVKISPDLLFVEDELETSISITNKGIKNAEDFSIAIFVDYNRDSLSQSNELVLTKNNLFLNSGDSITFTSKRQLQSSGATNLVAIVSYTNDENLENNKSFMEILIRPKPNNFSDVVINEIMYKPINDEPEWVELYNRTTKVINLKGWRFADRTSKPQIIDSTFFIGANQYLVLTEDETITEFYNIDSNIIVTNLPSLNNLGDDLKLIDSLNKTIDSVFYKSNWGGGSGRSLERISVDNFGNDSTNWNSSISYNFATPNKINSITPKNYDLQISEFRLIEDYGVVGETVTAIVKIKNIGLRDVGNYSINFYLDNNKNNLPDEDEQFREVTNPPINKGDSTSVEIVFNNYQKGINKYLAKVFFEDEEEPENNLLKLQFVGVEINEIRSDVAINEIMHSPFSPEPEWIELFNNSEKTINLKNYQIADMSDTSIVINTNMFFEPNNYLVIADDSDFVKVHPEVKNIVFAKFPNLNNSGDRVLLLDSLNRVIDSLVYSSEFGGKNGNSLERINPDKSSTDTLNWTSSRAVSGTPGKVNSVSKKNYDVELSEILFLPETPKPNDNVSISVLIKNKGKLNADFALELSEIVLPDSNLLLRETSEMLNLATDDSLIYSFNYKIDSLLYERCFEVTTIEFADEDSTNNSIESSIIPSVNNNSIIINEVMYAPLNGEAEWIELYNQSENAIDLTGFSISDIYTTPKKTTITNRRFLLQPDEYAIITKDSFLLNYHKEIPCKVIVNNFANLNNDIDGIVIKDAHGITIDSLLYKSTWGGTNGFSLERVLNNLPSSDSLNWKSSIDIEQSTPGRKNSVTPFEHDLGILELTTLPAKPKINDTLNITVVITNAGLYETGNFTLNIYYNTNLLETISCNSIVDSTTIISEHSFQILDSVKIVAEIFSEEDENITNNKIEKEIYPGALEQSIIINEFMSNPNTGFSEWIELFNPGNEHVDISSWFISDMFPSANPKLICENPLFIKPNEYLIITNDSSKYNYIGAERVVEVKFNTLGNTEDGIILCDFNQSVIDSLRYTKEWEISKGRSMERVSVLSDNNDITNWLPSLGISGSSAGVKNSVTETEPAFYNSIIINEIMYEPGNNNCDFIEIYNPGKDSVNIGGWNIIDGSGSYTEVSKTNYDLSAGSYFLIAADSSVFNKYNLSDISYSIGVLNLSLSGESLTLIDHWGNTIDSVYYNPDWHNRNILSTKDKSLERISPTIESNIATNWSTSVDNIGATPNRVNSIFTENSSAKNGITFSPNPFSPDSDGFEDFTIINYVLPFSVSQIRIKVFDDKGRLVRTIENSKAVSQNGSIIFDGLDDSGNPLKIGMYIIFLEAISLKGEGSVSYKDVIVVARKL